MYIIVRLIPFVISFFGHEDIDPYVPPVRSSRILGVPPLKVSVSVLPEPCPPAVFTTLDSGNSFIESVPISDGAAEMYEGSESEAELSVFSSAVGGVGSAIAKEARPRA